MPDIKTIHDKDSYILPSVAEMRASQKKGSEGPGMNDPDCKMGDQQGHQVDIRED